MNPGVLEVGDTFRVPCLQVGHLELVERIVDSLKPSVESRYESRRVLGQLWHLVRSRPVPVRQAPCLGCFLPGRAVGFWEIGYKFIDHDFVQLLFQEYQVGPVPDGEQNVVMGAVALVLPVGFFFFGLIPLTIGLSVDT